MSRTNTVAGNAQTPRDESALEGLGERARGLVRTSADALGRLRDAVDRAVGPEPEAKQDGGRPIGIGAGHVYALGDALEDGVRVLDEIHQQLNRLERIV